MNRQERISIDPEQGAGTSITLRLVYLDVCSEKTVKAAAPMN